MKNLFFIAALFLFSPLDSFAQTYGDWRVSSSNNGGTYTAETRNDSNQSFGLVCLVESQNCWWALAIDPTCNHQESYPIMVNSDMGAMNLSVMCVKVGSDHLMAFQDFATIDKIARGAGKVGFALPMQDGAFRVFRFSLKGSSLAADQANELTIARGTKSTRDLTL